MKLQFVSDLHIEFFNNMYFLHSNKLKKEAEILIMAGDIYLFSKNTETLSYFDYLAKTFQEVYWLPGNHEYYNSDVIRYHKFLQKEIRPNIHIVNNQVISIEDVNLIFTTLWGNISVNNELFIKSHVSDFSLISYDGDDFRPKQFNQLHDKSVQFLETELLKRQKEKNVVITHHVPTLFDYPENYKNSSINQAFAVEMFDLIEKYQPEAWIYGHSHVNTPDFTIGKTKLVTNQLGYVDMDEHKTFKIDKFIDV